MDPSAEEEAEAWRQTATEGLAWEMCPSPVETPAGQAHQTPLGG